MVTENKGKVVIRMSSSGHCVRALTAELSGKYDGIKKTVPVWLEESAIEGQMHEKWIKNQMEIDGFNVFDEQIELKIEQPEFILLGHIDGKDLPPLDRQNPFARYPELLEIKSMSEFEFQRWRRGKFNEFPQYASQLACYMTATNLNYVRYLVKNRSSGYKDINLWDYKSFPLIEEYNKVIINCNIVVSSLEHNTLPEREYDGSTLECRRCFFDKLCIHDVMDLNILELLNSKELVDTTNRYREALEKMNEYKLARDQEKQILKEQLKATGLKKMTVNQLAVQLITVKQRIDYPKTKLLSFFTPDALAPAATIKEGYEFLRIDDKMSERLEYGKDEETE